MKNTFLNKIRGWIVVTWTIKYQWAYILVYYYVYVLYMHPCTNDKKEYCLKYNIGMICCQSSTNIPQE